MIRARTVQDRALAAYVRDHLYPYSSFYRARLDAAGLGRDVAGRDEWARLPVTRLADVDDPRRFVLHPDERTIQRFASFTLIRRMFWAKLTGRQGRLVRELIEPAYKPIHWVLQDGIPVGSSAEDLDRLAELGRRWLELAGLARSDVVLGILPPGPDLAYWELVLACHRAGVSALHLAPVPTPAQAEAAQPSVIVGRAAALEVLLTSVRDDQRHLPALRTILVAGDRPSDVVRRRLRNLTTNTDVAVTFAWAPSGVRALWAECRGGDSLHTWPDTELLELADPLTGEVLAPPADGELVWSPIGWKGTALARLATGVHAGVEDQPCPNCGRRGPRVRLGSSDPPFAAVLDAASGVLAWQAEIRTAGGTEELVVFVALDPRVSPGRVLRALDRELSVTQFVVEDDIALAGRLARSGHRRVLDLRGGADRVGR